MSSLWEKAKQNSTVFASALTAGLAVGVALPALVKKIKQYRNKKSINKQLLGMEADKWFIEANEQWPGTAHALEVEKVLFSKQSDYQDVMVVKTTTFGNVLILDGVLQLTERDEIAYQEMMTHVPIFAHPNPKRVLLVGGGDGGILTQVFKHKSVEECVICEIDQVVMDASKEFFPKLAGCWNDPRLTVHRGDAAEYMKRPEIQGKFDVIISDTSDPVGPAQALFEAPFYRDMHSALAPGGVICTQAESIWLNLDLVQRLVRNGKEIFATAEYAVTYIPTYPCGSIGLLVCRKQGGEQFDTCTRPVREVAPELLEQLEFYTPELHTAAFTKPAFVERKLTPSALASMQ